MYPRTVLRFLTISFLSRTTIAVPIGSSTPSYGPSNEISTEGLGPVPLNPQPTTYPNVGPYFPYGQLSPYHLPPPSYYTDRRLADSELATFLPEFMRFMETMMILMANTPRSSKTSPPISSHYNGPNFPKYVRPNEVSEHGNPNPSYAFLTGDDSKRPEYNQYNEDNHLELIHEQNVPNYEESTYRFGSDKSHKTPQEPDIPLKSMTHAKDLSKYCVFQGISPLFPNECGRYLVCLPARFNRFHAFIAECPDDKKFSTIYRRCVQPYLVPECSEFWKPDSNPNSEVEIFPSSKFPKKKYEKPLFRPIKEVESSTETPDAVVSYEPPFTRTKTYEVGKTSTENSYFSEVQKLSVTETQTKKIGYELNEEVNNNGYSESANPSIYGQNGTISDDYPPSLPSTNSYVSEESPSDTSNKTTNYAQEYYDSQPLSYQVIDDVKPQEESSAIYSDGSEPYASPSYEPIQDSTPSYHHGKHEAVTSVYPSVVLDHSSMPSQSTPNYYESKPSVLDSTEPSSYVASPSTTNYQTVDPEPEKETYTEGPTFSLYRDPPFETEPDEKPYSSPMDHANGTKSSNYNDGDVSPLPADDKPVTEPQYQNYQKSSPRDSNDHTLNRTESYRENIETESYNHAIGESPQTAYHTETSPTDKVHPVPADQIHSNPSDSSYLDNQDLDYSHTTSPIPYNQPEEASPGESYNGESSSTDPLYAGVYPNAGHTSYSNESDPENAEYKEISQTEIPYYSKTKPDYLKSEVHNYAHFPDIFTTTIYEDEYLKADSTTDNQISGDYARHHDESQPTPIYSELESETSSQDSISTQPRVHPDPSSTVSQPLVPNPDQKVYQRPFSQEDEDEPLDNVPVTHDYSYENVGHAIKETPYVFPPHDPTDTIHNPVRRSVRGLDFIDQNGWRKPKII